MGTGANIHLKDFLSEHYIWFSCAVLRRGGVIYLRLFPCAIPLYFALVLG